MQIKITLRYHFILMRLAKVSKLDNTFFGKVMEKQAGMQTGTMPWRGIWKYLTKLHAHLLFNPVIPFLEIYPEDTLPSI